MQEFFPFPPRLLDLAAEVERDCAGAFAQIERVCEHNSLKVLRAFTDNRVSESHLLGTSGYGYDDRGRDTLDAVFAQTFGAEDALVRHHFASGTAAIATVLFGLLRPGDAVVSLTGLPYDTLHGVLGIRGEGGGSLKDFGIRYRQLDLRADGRVDLDAVPEAVRGAKVAYLQRSRGYSLRPSLSVGDIARIAEIVRARNPGAWIVVDNCYGEFVERLEPTQAGADLVVGSLIKNPGGGIARTGGYIAGSKQLVELCAQRLTAPGVGREVGCSLNENKNMYMGLFSAPGVVAAALKTAVFAAGLFGRLGYGVLPGRDEPRADIIQTVVLGSPQGLRAFCRGIQAGAPVDSFVTPEPWDMPGYDDQVIMAAGAFNMGASIELSADGPMREPYAAWMQGALNYPTGKLGVLTAAHNIQQQEAPGD